MASCLLRLGIKRHVLLEHRRFQIFGGLGVTSGVKVEELYREVRALRIYEGASEVQKLVIARETLKAAGGG